jgi:hypothetical protein
MEKATIFLLALGIFILCGCSGSDTYRGEWKATDSNGGKFTISFAAKDFSVKDEAGKTSNYKYSQNSISIQNSVETYGIKLDDGRSYIINFPIANDESKGIIKDAGNNPIYAISRNGYITYDDLYKLNGL